MNGGINHFGSPFNFPEEFVSVYRLHALVPDLLEYRELHDAERDLRKDPGDRDVPRQATDFMHDRGLANWALSMGRQRLGAARAAESPAVHAEPARWTGCRAPTKQIDVAALDLIRDRERGVPRFNEFRRQYGLRTAHRASTISSTGIVAKSSADTQSSRSWWRRCARSTASTSATRRRSSRARSSTPTATSINDCLGHPDGSMVDNVEDLDTVVGWLAETTRPHGFAISETQFVVFILNASRRLFSDRFFTSSFRPEIYSTIGLQLGEQQRPDGADGSAYADQRARDAAGVAAEAGAAAHHAGARAGARPRANAFDPWARDRGEYYSLDWKPRKGAENDEAFKTSASRSAAPVAIDPDAAGRRSGRAVSTPRRASAIPNLE